MSRLETFRFGNLRRKRVILVLFIVAMLLFLSTVILLVLGIFGFRSELVSISMTDDSQNVTYNGVGLNLDYIPNVNLIIDPSFEKEDQYHSITVLDCQGKSLYFAPDDVAANDINTTVIAGADIRVVSIDGDGHMLLRYEGEIESYESARLGQRSDILIADYFASNSHITKTCVLQNTVAALTDAGTVIADVTSEQLLRFYDGGNVSFADICCNNTYIYAVTHDGVIYYSADGKVFAEMNDVGDSAYMSVKECAATDNVVTILTETKDLYVFSSGAYHKVSIPAASGVAMIGASADAVIAILDDGSIYRSANGLVYAPVDAGSIYEDRTAAKVFCRNDKAYILNTDGTITIIDMTGGEEARLLAATSSGNATAKSIVVTDNGQIVVSTDDNTAVLILEDTDEKIIISAENETINNVFPAPGNRVMIAEPDKLYSAAVLSDFTLFEQVPDDSIQMGDICFIRMTDSQVSLAVTEDGGWSASGVEGSWDAYGEGTRADLSIDGFDGQYAVRMSGITDNTHILSQKLTGTVNDNFAKDKFYRISVFLKGDNASMTPENVRVWLTGKSFGKQGLTASGIDDEYSEYSAVFAVNDTMLSDDTLRFNIAFDGVGSVLIDQVFVGTDQAGKADIPQAFTDGVKSAVPEVIRLNNLSIGTTGFSDKVFWGTAALSSGAGYVKRDGHTTQVSDVRSLERSLRLVKDSSSNPWFVLGSYTSPELINNMVTYLCGSVSSEYGSLRIKNGTALPWSRQFDKIYFEIADTEGCFDSDVQRGSFVDYVMSMITKAEMYTDIKDKIVFIDGMNYENGMILSSADAHSSSMKISTVIPQGDQEMSYAQILTKAYDRTRNSIPRVSTGRDRGEFISSLEFEGQFNIAQYMAAVLSDDAYFADMVMIDCDASFKPSEYDDDGVFAGGSDMRMILDMMALIKEIGGCGRMYANLTDPLSDKSGQTVERFKDACKVSQFDSPEVGFLVVANTSDSQSQFIMYNASRTFTSSAVKRYSMTGKLINTKRLTNSYRRYNLQPGEVIIVRLDR